MPSLSLTRLVSCEVDAAGAASSGTDNTLVLAGGDDRREVRDARAGELGLDGAGDRAARAAGPEDAPQATDVDLEDPAGFASISATREA